MTTLGIDRLSAYYHDVDLARIAVFDDALCELADHALDDELSGREPAGVLASAWAVCLDELAVAVDLDPTRPAIAASWASVILEAVTAAVDDTGAGVVVYWREADALIDLVTATARGDMSRLWAWRQVRVVGPGVRKPTPADVAAAALARPSLIPAVLAAAGPECRAIFRVDDWIRLAHTVVRLIGSPPWSAVDAGPGYSGMWAIPPTRSRDAAACPVRWQTPVGTWATVPAHVWSKVAHGPDRWALAVLCQAVAGPHLARDRTAIAAIVDEVPALHGPPVDRAATPASDTRESSTSPDEFEKFDADAVTSAWGGVWFLAHALLDLGVVDGLGAGSVGATDLPDALVAIVVAVTGAPADDPSVSGLCGRDDSVDIWAPKPEQEQEIERYAAAITRWLAERANGRLAARLAEPSTGSSAESLWRRTVTIETPPGRIEVTSALTDVDIDIRIAGLDIDPGFVWWLGADVEFRYV